jgi:hypothetical protein
MHVITSMIWINLERDSVIINDAYKANKFNKSAWPGVLTATVHGKWLMLAEKAQASCVSCCSNCLCNVSSFACKFCRVE